MQSYINIAITQTNNLLILHKAIKQVSNANILPIKAYELT